MTLGFTPHLMATPRRGPAENPLPGAPMSPTSPGNHTATDSSNSPSRPDLQFATHRLWTIVEEGLEMFGVVVFIYALVSYVDKDTQNPSVVLKPKLRELT